MKIDSMKPGKTLELQQRFLISLSKSNPEKIKELSKLLKKYSKREIKLDLVYDNISGKI
jgi:hypothetical protein